MRNNFRTALFALMLVLFIDGMGQGIIFPVLTSLFNSHQPNQMVNHLTKNQIHFYYGLIIGVYYFAWFLSAPLLGDWSDKIGRKKALITCLLIASCSFALSAVALSFHTLLLFIISRLIGGVTSGDQAIAKAAIIDKSPPQHKSIYLGLVLFAVTLGLVIGPLIGATLINSNYITGLNIKTPFYFAAFLAGLNIIFLFFFFQENNTLVKHKVNIKFHRAFSLFFAAFKLPEIKYLLISYILTQLGWQLFYINLPYYVNKTWHYSAIHVGYLLSVVGLGLGVGLGLLPMLLKNYNYLVIAKISYRLLALCLLSIILTHTHWVIWLLVILTAVSFSVAAVHVLPLFSDRINNQQQGWILGVTGSVVALTGGLGSLFVGLLLNFHSSIAFVIAFLLILSGLAFLR